MPSSPPSGVVGKEGLTGAHPTDVPLRDVPLRALALRVLVLALVLGSEAILASLFLDGATLAHKEGVLTGFIRDHGAWVVKGLIGFAALFTTFAFLRYKAELAVISDEIAATRISPAFFALHLVAIALFGFLSAILYAGAEARLPWDAIAAAWIAAALAAVFFIGLAAAPWRVWVKLVRGTGRLWAFASAASVLACFAGAMSWRAWGPATRLTFSLVKIILQPFVSHMVVQPAVMRIGTDRFTAIVSPECSGLEGAALMLIFGLVWLVLFRKEIRFPQAFALLPAGIVALFLLNAVRIAALIMIGHAGAREIAIRGFHSQAGWIAFNSVAFGFAVAAGRVSWFSVQRPDRHPQDETLEYPAAPYLVPFLMILAAGMISRAASGIFEWAYSLRFFAALAALWLFRRKYSKVDWRFGWLGPFTGVVVFALWIALDRFSGAVQTGSEMPSVLAGASPGIRVFWIAFRVLGAVLTVPIAEELAFRGFLLRRLISADFEGISFRTYTVFSLLPSSFIFGLLHGGQWLAGTAAGVLYALASLRRGRLGEAVAAHATTNALLAVYILTFNKWHLW